MKRHREEHIPIRVVASRSEHVVGINELCVIAVPPVARPAIVDA
jgi:hypothetical protein